MTNKKGNTGSLVDNLPNVRPHPDLGNQYKHLKVLVASDGGAAYHDAATTARIGDGDEIELMRHVTIVVLDRPSKRNAIHSAMWKEIGDVFSVLGRMGDNCRAVLLVGNGRSFCAGIDFTDDSFFPATAATDEVDVARVGIAWLPKLQQMQACFTALETCPVPIVAAIHGPCIGAGMDLICSADVRLCSTDATFSVREVAVGLAADVGTLQRLPKIVGNQSMVRELCLTGRDFTATQAVDLGLVSQSMPSSQLIQHALQICANMARHSPLAVQGTKAALLYARDHSVSDGLAQIGWYNSLALQSSDTTRSLMSRVANERPTFSPMPLYSKL